MKVILQRDVPKVGKGGDIVTVADGYARNFLLPRQYAVAATGGALKDYNARMARDRERGARLVEHAQGDAAKLDGHTLTLIGKVGSGTKLYGSVTAHDVAEAIARDLSMTVDRRRVGLVNPIKTLGVYDVPVRLHSDVTVTVRVDVTTEEEIERRRAQAEAERLAAERAAAEAASAETPAEAVSEAVAAGAEAESAGSAE